jgi:hypothetical protein
VTALELESAARLVLRARGKAHIDKGHEDRVRHYFGDYTICIERIVRTIDGVVEDSLEVLLERDGGHIGVYDVTALRTSNGRVIEYDEKLAKEAGAHLLQVGLLDIIAGQGTVEG